MENHYRHRGMWLRCVMALLCLLFTSLTASAYVVGDYIEDDNFIYKITNDSLYTVSITSVKIGGVVRIPETFTDKYDNKWTITEVRVVGATADLPEEKTSVRISSLYLSNTVKSLNVSYMPSCDTVHISKSVTKIEGASLDYCYFTTDGKINSNPYFIAQDGQLYLHGSGFSDMTLLSVNNNVVLKDSTLNVLSLVKNVTATLSNPTIKHLKIPASVTSIAPPHASWSIADVTVADGNTTYYSVDGVLFKRSNKSIVYYPYAKEGDSYTLPDSIEYVAWRAFGRLKYLKNLDLNNAVKIEEQSTGGLLTMRIGSKLKTACFRGAPEKYIVDPANTNFKVGDCGELLSYDGTWLYSYPTNHPMTKYKIPSGVKYIAPFTFGGVRGVDTLVVASTVTELKSYAFYGGCKFKRIEFEAPSQLKKIPATSWGVEVDDFVLPSSITSLGAIPSNITELEIPEGSEISKIEKGTWSRNIQKLVITGGSITEIPDELFHNNTNLTTIVLPPTLKKIGRNAFNGCTSLDSIAFADGCEVETLEEGCFANTSLKSVTIPASVKTIGKEAFRECAALTRVDLSENVDSISPEAFKHCYNLSTFTVDENNQNYSAVKGYLCSKDKSELLIFPPAKANEDVTLLPPSITRIGRYSFYECDNLKSIVIPKKVTKIGERAFGLCKNLESIAFLCDEMIPSSAINQEVNHMAFDSTAFENVTLSCVRADLAEQYSNDPFYSKFASGIKTTFETQRDDGGTDEYFPLSNDRMMLMKTTSRLQTYVVGDAVKGEDGKMRSVNMIGDYAFEGSKAEEVVLKKNVHYLGAAAFWTDIAHTTSGAKAATGAATRATSASTEVITPESTTIKSVYFCGDKAPSQLATVDYDMDATFNEFAPEQKIYVRKSVVKDFQEALPKYSDQIDYRITDLKISNGYATFSREFDVDLNDLRSGVSNPVTGTPETVDGSYNGITAYFCGDNGVESWHADGEDHYVIHMTPIDENCDRRNYGKGYIPAGTGVLLKLETSDGGKATPDNYYYTIGEYPGEVNVTTRNSVMHGVVDEDTVISHSTTDGTSYWVMQKGYFREVLDGQSIKVPRHKAYLELVEPATASGSKASLSIGIGGSTTDIVSIDAHGNVESATDGAMYNLAGQRVGDTYRGVVVRNGKKTVIK